MGHAPGKGAQGFHLARILKLAFQLLSFFLCLFSFNKFFPELRVYAIQFLCALRHSYFKLFLYLSQQTLYSLSLGNFFLKLQFLFPDVTFSSVRFFNTCVQHLVASVEPPQAARCTQNNYE